MRFFAAAVTIPALTMSLVLAQDICHALDPADADKNSFQVPVSCEGHDTDCVEACVTFFHAPNSCTESIGAFDGNEALWVYDVLQDQKHKTGQDATSDFNRRWAASFAPGTTSLAAPWPHLPNHGIYGVWDYGLFYFAYDIDQAARFVPDRIQFAIRYKEDDEAKAIFVDAVC